MRMLTVGARTLLVPVALSLVVAAPHAAGAARLSTISRTSSLSYPGCPTGAVTLTVTVPSAPVPSGVPVRYRVTLRNTGSQACGPPKAPTTVSGRSSSAALQLFGQCGTFPVVIEDRHGARVYPPFEAVLCPVEVAPRLGARAEVTSAQRWNQREGGGRPARRTQLAPSGSYHVAVGGTSRASFVLAPPSHRM